MNANASWPVIPTLAANRWPPDCTATVAPTHSVSESCILCRRQGIVKLASDICKLYLRHIANLTSNILQTFPILKVLPNPSLSSPQKNHKNCDGSSDIETNIRAPSVQSPPQPPRIDHRELPDRRFHFALKMDQTVANPTGNWIIPNTLQAQGVQSCFSPEI